MKHDAHSLPLQKNLSPEISGSAMSFFEKDFTGHDRELISLNIREIDLSWATDAQGAAEIENDDITFILESLNWNIDRQHNGQIKKATIDKVLKMRGGWCIMPSFALADRQQINYFRFKPENPPADWKKPGKSQKYLGAVGTLPRAYLPNVSIKVWQKIADRYQVPVNGDCFGTWLLNHPEIPVIPTEGEKKALAALAAGYAAVSIPGIDCGYRSISEKEDGSEGRLELIDDLKALATNGRKILIGFDRDSAPRTIKRVQQARRKLAQLFAEIGSETYSIRWPDQYKGLDDFIFGAGQRALDEAIKNPQNITPPASNDAEDKKPKIPPALAISKLVFTDLFAEKIRFDASNKQYWRYDGRGKWVVCSDEFVFGIVQEYLEESVEAFSPSYVRNVIEFARKDFLHEGWTEASSLLYLPFTNGVLEISSNSLLPHSPDYGFTWQLPREYSIEAGDWDKISDFLKTFCCENKQLGEIALAFCNAVLKGRSDLQKFSYLFGSGANGKGALMRLLAMLVGDENTHTTTMAELCGNRFESANLKNKRLVLMTDEDKGNSGFGIFKAATGQDPIRFERKGKDASNFIFKGMMVVAANSPTFTGESNPALKRRKVDFPCLARIPESDRRDLTPEFEADLPAFTTYLLSLSDDWVTETIRRADQIEVVRALSWEMAIREDSIAAFYDEHLITEDGSSIKCGELYKHYQSYCEASGLKAKSINNFTPNLLELCNASLGHSIERRHTRDGKSIFGLRIRSDVDERKTTTSSTSKNTIFLSDIERWSQSSQMTVEKNLKVVTKPSQVITVVTDEDEF
jgi:putative DNA primase/helicase